MGACDYFWMRSLNLPGVIKEIGRGKNAAGDLSREDAQTLFRAILEGRVPELELGAILVALRVKGETLDELAGFAAACEASYAHLQAVRPEPFDFRPSSVRPERSAAKSKDEPSPIPVVIPSYNGARVLPNLVPLLALLLARAGIPVLIHGVTQDPGRVTTCEVLQALGMAPAASADDAAAELKTRGLSFLPIEVLAPSVARVLSLRARLGVRNSTHTLVKMLQPFGGAAVRIVSVTHPEYLTRMREYFTQHDADALLLRGAEGEAVAHPRREPAIDWAHGRQVEMWTGVHASTSPHYAQHEREELPHRDAESTARWIEAALAGKAAIPAPIEHQVECCKRALSSLRAAS